jgi:VWFA-related protein
MLILRLCAFFALAVSLSAEPRTRIIYVSAVDKQGGFVTDLSAGDFSITESGKAREVVSAELTNAPMNIALIVDDNGTGIFRYPAALFISRLREQAQVSVTTVTGQPMRLVDYTSDLSRLTDAVRQLGPRPSTPDGGQLLSGIFEAAEQLRKREAVRPIIVALTVGGEEHSPIPAHQVLERLQQTGTSLHVVAVVGSVLRTTAAISKPSDLLEANMSLNEVLGDGPKQSGGRREEIVATVGPMNGLQRIAEDLLHQYRLVYALPDGVRSSGRVNVSSSRAGVSLRAPTRVPTR